MLAKAFRFHGYGSLNYVYKQGEQVRSPLFSMRYVLNTRRKSPRVAVVVSKKVHKSAVVRNRIRRRVYELVRQHQPAITQPFDMVITVFSEEVATTPSTELTKAITTLLSKAKII